MGFTPLAIAERLGHEKIETTLNTYSHLYPNKQGELADKLEIENSREEIEAKILPSGLSKKDYFVHSCIYNRVCVVGKKELVYQLVEELKIMQTNIREVTEQFEKTENDLTPEVGFQWLGDYEITVDEVLGGIVPKANKMEQAKRLLRELAETNNAMQSNEIFNLADEQGISKTSFRQGAGAVDRMI